MQNGICEAFNGRMRDELLNETIFYNLGHARDTLARWSTGYNRKRPHSALGYLTPVIRSNLHRNGRSASQP
jgi:putative transposase